VCVPISSLYLLIIEVPPGPDLNYSLFSRDPSIAAGSQFSESRFHISISGRKVPTII